MQKNYHVAFQMVLIWVVYVVIWVVYIVLCEAHTNRPYQMPFECLFGSRTYCVLDNRMFLTIMIINIPLVYSIIFLNSKMDIWRRRLIEAILAQMILRRVFSNKHLPEVMLTNWTVYDKLQRTLNNNKTSGDHFVRASTDLFRTCQWTAHAHCTLNPTQLAHRQHNIGLLG